MLRVLKESEFVDENLKLSNPNMTPLDGDTETEFTFSVHYYNANNETPIFIQVVIDNIVYDLE